MRQSNLEIFHEKIHAGETVSLALPLPELFSCSPVYMPIKVMHGKQSGPCILLTAAMYGDSLNGTEIINRLLGQIDVKKLQGTVIAVPVLNVYGFMNRSRYLPGGLDLGHCFPGSASGTHAARMANLFVTEVFDKADVVIDLQTGFINYSNLPQVFVDFESEATKKLAEVFNAPVISNILLEEGMLSTLAKEKQKTFVMYESGEAMRFDEHAIRVGVEGILKVMHHLEMISENPEESETALKSFFTEKNIWLRAPSSGMSYTDCQLGQYLHKGEKLCVIKDPFGGTGDVVVKCPEDAVIVGKNNLPLVHEGESLFQLAVFSKMQHAATHLETWEEKRVETTEDAQ